MISKSDLIKLSDFLWEIPTTFRPDMKVPARFYASEKMLDDILKDRSVEQLINVSTLPGVLEKVLAMPDIHEGYGFPIGGVAAMKLPNGVISPGGIGYDVNCGVRLLLSQLTFDDAKSHFASLAREIYHQVPSGVGRGGQLKLEISDLDNVLVQGAHWMLKNNYATSQDLQRIESFGRLTNADASAISQQAKKRGFDQLGTLGAGNHFVEVDYVEEIYDENAAKTFGLYKNQLVVLIHTGSRGLGHQTATDSIRKMVQAMPKHGITLPDRELACVPFSSPEGQEYFNAMAAAANFAWANRQMITWEIRNAWHREFGSTNGELNLLYDVAHNIAKIEKHLIKGKEQDVIVHRKGATRAFPANHPEIPKEFASIGQPVIIPGSMGTASYVLAGNKGSMEQSFGSTCHGAGRKMSRTAAKKEIIGKNLRDELQERGIFIQAGSISDLAEEAPLAYKDIDDVINTVHNAGIANKVAKLKPCVVIKG
ncbi:TPA: RNA-splicing ligase RtcB [Candidatus Dependentiae bacterium]|nr:MAG: RNA-splicing ligase RtcB [candidate division TM6 bacterium GW2011_GWE2_31_21]KKP54054.1 MAG: RNA-splicing ligase RtcB [candidate division TM6 bacterium GW2011_GWF2_33_332]HBS48363.1 RNA-splicing ligase RtcB [Candidatus Dependentiae bacterium]HBZ72963.1 RNA-splicing ligase RtcB [Candidatus Dependentiae bacterium]